MYKYKFATIIIEAHTMNILHLLRKSNMIRYSEYGSLIVARGICNHFKGM